MTFSTFFWFQYQKSLAWSMQIQESTGIKAQVEDYRLLDYGTAFSFKEKQILKMKKKKKSPPPGENKSANNSSSSNHSNSCPHPQGTAATQWQSASTQTPVHQFQVEAISSHQEFILNAGISET